MPQTAYSMEDGLETSTSWCRCNRGSALYPTAQTSDAAVPETAQSLSGICRLEHSTNARRRNERSLQRGWRPTRLTPKNPRMLTSTPCDGLSTMDQLVPLKCWIVGNPRASGMIPSVPTRIHRFDADLAPDVDWVLAGPSRHSRPGGTVEMEDCALPTDCPHVG